MGCLWVFYRFSMDFLGVCLDFLWVVYRFSMDFLWVLRFPKICLWVFFRFSMFFFFFLGFLWIFYGLLGFL